MAITEIVTVPVNPDPENLEQIEKVFPSVVKYFTDPNPGIYNMFRGWYVSKDGEDVRGKGLEILIIEWNEIGSFHSFIGSETFKEFGGIVKPFLLGPPELQLFETDQSPADPARSSVVEIYRVSVKDSAGVSEARGIWEATMRKLGEKANVQAKLVHGKSLNLDEDTVLGLLGWSSLEERDRAIKDLSFVEGLDTLRSLGKMSQAVVEVDTLI